MADADATVTVRIKGDPRSLEQAAARGEKAIGGLSATTKGLIAGAAIAVATDQLVDFGATALAEGDRVGDALTRLETQLDRDLVAAIDKAAGKMTDLGQSRQDVLELAAAFTDTATALGVADPLIASFAPKAAETAAAMALISDVDADTTIDLIGKAAAGSDKALRALGVNLSDAEVEARALRDSGKDTPEMLTDSELAAARYNIVLEKLAPRLEAVTGGTADFEQASGQLQAKFETLMGKIGEGLDGPLTDLVDWTLDGIAGWERFAEVMEDDVATGLLAVAVGIVGVLPFGNSLVGMLDDINGAAKAATRSLTEMYQSTPNPDRRDGRGLPTGTSEAGIVAAINSYSSRNGLTVL